MHNFSGWAQDMGKIENKAICNTHEKYNQPKLLRWLATSSFINGFFKLPEWHQCNQVQDDLSFHPHFAKFFQLKNQTSFELQVHIGKPTRWNVVILKCMDDDNLFPIFSSSCDFALWQFLWSDFVVLSSKMDFLKNCKVQ